MPGYGLIRLDYETLDEEDFMHIAKTLFNYTCLRMLDGTYRLVEIEFYLRSDMHPDPYVHANPEQLLSYKYYFHRHSNGTYKSGTYKGMDLTFGDADSETYFGILIRAIMDTSTGQVIEGPCNVVNHILGIYCADSIADMTDGEAMSIKRNVWDCILEPTDLFERTDICVGPRIGLSAKYLEYQNRPYRFVLDKNLVKKQKTRLIKS